MPTENRSRNTEMVSVPAAHDLASKVRETLDRQACPNAWMVTAYEAVVANFPQPAPQPHPEPIAWMVGTAFWWTKEEAERDAAATGLPIVGLGAITDAAEVEQLRAALKFYADRAHFAEDIGSDWDSVSGEPANMLWHEHESWFVEDGSIARAALSGKSEQDQRLRIADPSAISSQAGNEGRAFWLRKMTHASYDC